MRPQLKKLYTVIKNNSAIADSEKFKQLKIGLVGSIGQEQYRKFLADQSLKLKNPISIKSNTRAKSGSASSGSIIVNFKHDCKIIGLVKHITNIAVLDRLSIDYLHNFDKQNPNSEIFVGQIDLSMLNTEILEQIAEQF